MRISLYDYVTLECAELDYINTKYSLEVAEMKYCAYVEDGNDEGIIIKIREWYQNCIVWFKKFIMFTLEKIHETYSRYVTLDKSIRDKVQVLVANLDIYIRLSIY